VLGHPRAQRADAAEAQHLAQRERAPTRELGARLARLFPLLRRAHGLVALCSERGQRALDQLGIVLGQDGATIAGAIAHRGRRDVECQVLHAGLIGGAGGALHLG